MRPPAPEMRIRVRKVKTHGLPDWLDWVLGVAFFAAASLPFCLLGWALWDRFA